MKKQLERTSKKTIVKHNIESRPLVLAEPHIGELTFVEDLYEDIVKLCKDKNATLHLAGDLLNADDLRNKGMITDEFVVDQMDDFAQRFLPLDTKLILQVNHGTKMYNKDILRQYGLNLTNRWDNIMKSFRLAHGTTVLSPEENEYELHLTNNKDKVLATGMVVHPAGLASPNAYLNRVKELYGSGYDFIIPFHFHKKFDAEIIRQIPNNYFSTTEFKCVPPIIENPVYGRGKYPPIHAGFMVIHKDRDFIGRERINYEVVQK